MRASREADGLVARREVDIEPCDKGMYEVIASAGELVGNREGEVCRRAGVEVEGQNGRRVCHSSLDLNCINERFG